MRAAGKTKIESVHRYLRRVSGRIRFGLRIFWRKPCVHAVGVAISSRLLDIKFGSCVLRTNRAPHGLLVRKFQLFRVLQNSMIESSPVDGRILARSSWRRKPKVTFERRFCRTQNWKRIYRAAFGAESDEESDEESNLLPSFAYLCIIAKQRNSI